MQRKKSKTISTPEEKALYSKLCRILDDYSFIRSDFDPLGDAELKSGKDAANRALNVLNKCSVSRRVEVLKKVLDDVEASIASKRSTKDVFYSVEEITKKYSNSVKTSKNNQDTQKDVKNPYIDEELIKKINTYYDERFDNRNLILLGCKGLNNQIKGIYSKLSNLAYVGTKAPSGPQEVFSQIYLGFFNCQKKDIINDLTEAGYKVKKNPNLVDFMNNDVLKYFEICLTLVRNTCEEYYSELKDSKVRKEDINSLTSDVVKISRNVKKAYSDRFGTTPRKEFLNNPYIPIRDNVGGAQMSLGDVLTEEEKEEFVDSAKDFQNQRKAATRVENNPDVLGKNTKKGRGR